MSVIKLQVNLVTDIHLKSKMNINLFAKLYFLFLYIVISEYQSNKIIYVVIFIEVNAHDKNRFLGHEFIRCN